MGSELNLLQYADIKQDLIAFFKRRSLIPIVGAGISCGSQAHNGNIPSGWDYMKHMLEELDTNEHFSDAERTELQNANFSTLCDYYEDDANVSPDSRFLYLKNNFYNTFLDEDDVRRRFFEIDWPYIYSLNIDDAIERSSDYKTIILPKREFRDEMFDENKCLIKFHGDIGELVAYKDGCKIFTSKEYALSLEQNAPLLNKLRNDYANQNILFIGCSLNDEIDLKTLSALPVDFKAKDSLRKTIIFIKGSPGMLQKSKYKTFGVTDVVSFDNYDSMYRALKETWEESQRIKESEIEAYESINIQYLKGTQRDQNHNYFFWGKGLLDSKTLKISYPYYFISRDLTADIINNLHKNRIHLIAGSRISGKSYLLAGLYREIRDRRVCFFDGKSRLSDTAMRKLLGFKKAVVLFDVGALSREQFETVIESAKSIRENGCNFIICINNNDSDTNGIIKYKRDIGLLDDTDIINYKIDNRLRHTKTSSELDVINKLLPAVNLPPYNESRTILDQLIYAERELGIKSRYAKCRIRVTHYKQLALLLILAIKEKVFSLDVTIFALDQEIIDAVKKYDPFIERVETLDYEKDANDLSSIKYVLNSKYWLRRELGIYAQEKDNYALIADAYRYIIHKVIAVAGSNEYRKRKLCKGYIMFDVMNAVFLNEYGGDIKLIVYIYEHLHEMLATDYNFLHQNAKCLSNYSYTLKIGAEEEKKAILLKARELAVVSKTMIDQHNEKSHNEHLLISIAHVLYTIASIRSNLCKLQKYTDFQEIEETIDIVVEALESPYNNEEQQEQRASKSITDFVKTVHNMLDTDSLDISRAHYRKAVDLMNLITFGYRGKRNR